MENRPLKPRRLTLAPGWEAALSGLDIQVSASNTSSNNCKGPWGKFWVLDSDDSDVESCGEDETSRDDFTSPCSTSIMSSQASNSIAPGELLSSSTPSVNGSSGVGVPGKCGGAMTRPWIGPLPKPRRSPKLTLGDALLMAKAGKIQGGRGAVSASKSCPAMIAESRLCPSMAMDRTRQRSGTTAGETKRGSRTERNRSGRTIASVPSSQLVATAACNGEVDPSAKCMTVGPTGNGLWRCSVRKEPYRPPIGLLALFDRAHAPQHHFHRAPKTKHRALGFHSYAASVRARPATTMENRGDAQQGAQGGRPGAAGAGRAAPRQGFQYTGSGQFRPGYGGGRGYAHRGRTWARPGHGRGAYGQAGGRGEVRPIPAGPDMSTPIPGVEGTLGTRTISGGSVGTAGDQAGMAAAILQQALSALQGMNAAKGGSDAPPPAAHQATANQSQPPNIEGKKTPPAPATEGEKKVPGKEKEGSLEAPKNTKGYCHRCYGKGHVMSDCSAKLLCEVCGTDTHIKLKCPVFNAPKVYAVPAGFGINKGGFFHIPSNKKLIKTKQDGRIAKINVSQGEISRENVIRELDRLFPEAAPWKVDQVTASSFSTIFPSAAELQRMVEWGPVHAKSQKAVLEIMASGTSEGRVKARLTDVWVQFDGLPSQLCTYHHIWGVGSTLGVTVEVDMPFFRKHGICRMKVAVIDPEAIPFAGEVEISKIIYEAHYWVEQGPLDGEPVPMESEFGGDEHGNSDRNKEEKSKEGNGQDNVSNKEEKDGKGKNDGSSEEEHKQVGDNGMDEPVDNDLLMHTDEVIKPVVLEEQAEEVENPMAQSDMAATIQQLAAIPEIVQSPAAERKRRSNTSDEHALIRAERLKAERNGGTNNLPDTPNLDCIFNIPVSCAVLNLSNIGVELGVNDREMADSVLLLDKVQKSRLVANNGVSMADVLDSESEDSSEENDIDKMILNNLCGEIMEEVMDVDLANNPNWQVSRHPSPSVRTTYVRKTKKKEKQEGI